MSIKRILTIIISVNLITLFFLVHGWNRVIEAFHKTYLTATPIDGLIIFAVLYPIGLIAIRLFYKNYEQ